MRRAKNMVRTRTLWAVGLLGMSLAMKLGLFTGLMLILTVYFFTTDLVNYVTRNSHD